MTTWGNICRICSSSADYEIFAKIPTYLHGSTNEFLNWQKPINHLLEETTGLKNSPDDGLPRHICAPCISYLKHAVSFREQCIKNALSLKLIQIYQQKTVPIDDAAKTSSDKESALITADDLRYVEQRPVHNLLLNNCTKFDATDKVHKRLLNQAAPELSSLNAFLQKQRLSERRNELLPTTSAGSGESGGSGNGEDEDYAPASSSDELEENALLRRHKNCYNYSETNFEDDDPMAPDELHAHDIKVDIPEPMWKERKCPACSKRFMFEDSYQSHIDNCVEHQFVLFIDEMSKLLSIRRQKMVSPHEFIRRMIFSLHKICTWLQEHSIDTILADKLQQVKLANANTNKDPQPTTTTTTSITTNTIIEMQTPANFSISGSTTPITAENNILYAIERSESRNSQRSTPVVKKPIAIRGTAAAPLPLAVTKKRDATERKTFLQKLQRAAVTPTNQTIPFSARCGHCNLVFDSVGDLELHNTVHHNGAAMTDCDEDRRRIIALFEDDI